MVEGRENVILLTLVTERECFECSSLMASSIVTARADCYILLMCYLLANLFFFFWFTDI